MTKPILVLPKGRLYNPIQELFQSKGIEIPDQTTRKYFYEDWSDDCSLFIAKPKSIPQLIHTKFADFGFCGLDIIKDSEYSDSMCKLLDTYNNKVKICLCSRCTIEELRSFKRPIVVATEFTHLASVYFTKLGLPHYILNTCGSTEGFLDINADCIIDVVETGETLKANKINILDILFESTTCLFGNKELRDNALPQNINALISK